MSKRQRCGVMLWQGQARCLLHLHMPFSGGASFFVFKYLFHIKKLLAKRHSTCRKKYFKLSCKRGRPCTSPMRSKVKRPSWSTNFSISQEELRVWCRGIPKHEPLTKKDEINVHVSRTLLNHSRTCLIIQ